MYKEYSISILMTSVSIPIHVKSNLESWLFDNQLPLTVSCLRSRLTGIYHSNDDALSLLHACHSLWNSKLRAWYLVHSPNTNFITKTHDGFVYSLTPHNNGAVDSISTVTTVATWRVISEDQLSQVPTCSCCANPKVLYCLHINTISTLELSKALLSLPCELISTNVTKSVQQSVDPILKAFEDEDEMQSCKSKRSKPLSQDIDEYVDIIDIDMECPKMECIHSNEKTLDGSFSIDNSLNTVQKKRKQIRVPKQALVDGYLVTEMVLQEISDNEDENITSKVNHNIQMNSSQKKPTIQKQGSLLKFFKKQ